MITATNAKVEKITLVRKDAQGVPIEKTEVFPDGREITTELRN
jgi:hypothetical protein